MNNTLYFPYIKPQHNQTLNTSLLFWDNIFTIVPDSINNPYDDNLSHILHEEGIVQSIRINESSSSVKKAEHLALKYLHLPSTQFLLNQTRNNTSSIHPDKLSPTLKDNINQLFSDEIFKELPYSSSKYRRFNNNDFVQLDNNFSNYYMSILANIISEEKGISLTAETTIYNSLFYDLTTNSLENNASTERNIRTESLELLNGIMAQITIEMPSLQKYKNTRTDYNNLKKIIKFHQEYEEERGQLRNALYKLANSSKYISDLYTHKELDSQIKHIYKYEVKSKLDKLKRDLKFNKIMTTVTPFQLTSFATASTAYATASSQMSVPIASMLAGMSVIMSGVHWWGKRKTILADNPYSYLMTMENRL